MRAVAGSITERFWHEGGEITVSVCEFVYEQAKEHKTVGHGEAVGVHEVDFELPITVLVIERIHIVAECIEFVDDLFENVETV